MTNELVQSDQLAYITNNKNKRSHGLISGVTRDEDKYKGNRGSTGTLHGGGYFNTKYLLILKKSDWYYIKTDKGHI